MSWIWRLAPVFAALAVILVVATAWMEANRSPDIVAAFFRSDESRCIVNDLTGG
jgi:predicted small integral membrane protein